MKKHHLKITTDFYEDVESGAKKFEVRKNDRDYRAEDIVVFYEMSDTEYEITYVLTHEQFPEGIMPGYCVFGMERV